MSYARQFGVIGGIIGLVAPVGVLMIGMMRGGPPSPTATFLVMAAGGLLFLGAAGRMIGQREDALVAANAELRILSDLLKRQSVTDELTRVANRRSFDGELEKEVARARRYHLPLALIMVDIDHFKRVNDDHGHPIGDQVLRNVAGLLDGEKRQGDLVARYGGEEFAAILPSTTAGEAAIWAERMRARLQAAPAATPAGEVHVTASFGVAAVSDETTTSATLIAAADRALYRAKDAGRNRVEIDASRSTAPREATG